MDPLPSTFLTRTHLADEHVRLVKVAAVELWRLSGNIFDFDAHLLALACRVHLLVVVLDGRHDSQVHELSNTKRDGERERENEE